MTRNTAWYRIGWNCVRAGTVSVVSHGHLATRRQPVVVNTATVCTSCRCSNSSDTDLVLVPQWQTGQRHERQISDEEVHDAESVLSPRCRVILLIDVLE